MTAYTQQENLKNSLVIYQPMIDPQHTMSEWYGGDIAAIHYKGFAFTLRAAGDVCCDHVGPGNQGTISVRDKSESGVFYKVMTPFISGDDELEKMMYFNSDNAAAHLVCHNTNWWEVFSVCDETNEPCGSYMLKSARYQDAIEEMISRLDEFIKAKQKAHALCLKTNKETSHAK